jgi:hypothetical protein
MNRLLRVAGWAWVAACLLGVMIVWRREAPAIEAPTRPAHVIAPVADGSPGGWFQSIKPYCNGVEVDVQLRNNPAPATLEGAGFAAACFALAGRIDRARAILDRVPASDRYRAVGIVFDVAHPVADAGDDRAAGPIMQMVVDYWPNHYMALYHAGMSEHILGQPDLARKHLEAFLQYYTQDDGWRHNAIEVLQRISSGR